MYRKRRSVLNVPFGIFDLLIVFDIFVKCVLYVKCMILPPFDEFGLLPPGDYPLTLAELRQSSLVVPSEGSSKDWDAIWRARLVDNLGVMTNQLWMVGVTNIFIDGSFVEEKDHPNDIDGYFECELAYLASGALQQDLNKLDPNKVWTWAHASRTPYANSTKKQLPMWHFYRVELYPHFGQSSGIKDLFGNDLQFPAAFRKSRTEHRQKGIIKLLQERASD